MAYTSGPSKPKTINLALRHQCRHVSFEYIEGYRKTPPYRSYYCCKSLSFIVNGIIQKSSHIIAGVRHAVGGGGGGAPISYDRRQRRGGGGGGGAQLYLRHVPPQTVGLLRLWLG